VDLRQLLSLVPIFPRHTFVSLHNNIQIPNRPAKSNTTEVATTTRNAGANCADVAGGTLTLASPAVFQTYLMTVSRKKTTPLMNVSAIENAGKGVAAYQTVAAAGSDSIVHGLRNVGALYCNQKAIGE
jgi:hypothetical protein